MNSLGRRNRQLEHSLAYVGPDVPVECAECGKHLLIDDLLLLESGLDRLASRAPNLIPGVLPPGSPASLGGLLAVEIQAQNSDKDIEMLHRLRGMNYSRGRPAPAFNAPAQVEKPQASVPQKVR